MQNVLTLYFAIMFNNHFVVFYDCTLQSDISLELHPVFPIFDFRYLPNKPAHWIQADCILSRKDISGSGSDPNLPDISLKLMGDLFNVLIKSSFLETILLSNKLLPCFFVFWWWLWTFLFPLQVLLQDA